MGRRAIREHIFKLLFMSGFYSEEELPEQVDIYLENVCEEEELLTEDEHYIRQKYLSIREKTPAIDEILNEISHGWKTSRMGRVDLNILRLAAYEICHEEDMPEKVAVNEAVEIAKKYGGDESASFINGLLGKIIRLNGEKQV